ncbi:MAG: hypothetical protein IPK15_15545 [Verrucomicrobia bacterium]|nr:hypothetical protein [Verrucomicrobiota bacterium]
METILGLLALAAFLIGGCCLFFLLFVQPIWGLVDVATSKHHSRGIKAAVILVTLLLLGPFATFFYACIGTRSRLLRITTLASFGVLLLAGALTLGMAMVVPAVQQKLTWWKTPPAENIERTATQPGSASAVLGTTTLEADLVDPETVPTFTAVQLARSGSQWRPSIAEFNGRGPRAQSALPVALPSIYPLTHVAVNPNGPVYYGITTHDVGLIVPNTGHFVELKPNPGAPKPSWPAAIAFDTQRELLLIAARSQGHSYNPKTGEWKTLPWLKDDGLIALACDATNQMLYGLQADEVRQTANTLKQFNAQGALLETIRLSSSIAVGRYPYAFAQLAFADGKLICHVSPSEKELNTGSTTGARIYLIEVASGQCRAVRNAALTSKE